MELGVGETAAEFVLEARHLREADRVDRGHTHFALDARFELVKRGKELLFASQHVAAEVEIELASGGQGQRAGGAVEQRRSKALLKLVDVLAGGRLTDLAV